MTTKTNWDNSGFYSAYLQTINKKPCGEYKNSTDNHCTLDQVQKLKEYSGILSPYTVLLDADLEPHSKNLLNLIEGENLPSMVTNRNNGRGIHALFFDNDEIIKKCGTGIMLACGIIVDIKTGNRNGLECLKFDKVEREIIYDNESYGQVPKYFTPIKSKIDFTTLCDGDGRNQALFNYILTLQGEGFTVEESRECIKLINKYVLKESLSDTELEVILRDEAFKKPTFFVKGTFQHDKFAKYIEKQYHVIKIGDRLHCYKDGIYVSDTTMIERCMQKEIENLKSMQRTEVLKQLIVNIDEYPQTDNFLNYIPFKNGLFDIKENKLIDFTPNITVKNQIPWNYNPNATDELMDKTLDKISCYDPEIRSLLEELAGACFYRSNKIGGGKAFILTGGKHNGKSTFLDIVTAMLGEKNTSALDLKDLDEKFCTGELFGKMANIGDDISSAYKTETSTFKKLVTGERITAQFKNEKPFEFTSYAKLLFSANDIPRMSDQTGAVLRRLIIIPFNAKFLDTDPDHDKFIKYKLIEQNPIEYFILLALEGLQRVLNNGLFTKSKTTEEAQKIYDIENNPVKSFVEETGIDQILDRSTDEIYLKYDLYCHTNGYKGVLSKNNFSRQLRDNYQITTKSSTIKGKPYRMYVLENSKTTLNYTKLH